jgi:hypothetical protein
MAKTKKTRRAVAAADDENTPVREVAEEKSGPTHFVAILKGARTYNLAGRTFLRGEPVEVPIKHLKMFKQNGWFLVQQPR